MQDIAIFGAGGLGRELAAMIGMINAVKPTWHLIGFFDDGIAKDTKVSHYGKVLGGVADVNGWQKPLGIIIGVGAPLTRKAIRTKISNPLVTFPNLIYPDFLVYDTETFSIGEGNVITNGCIATVNVKIGNYNLINGSVEFGHDDVVGDYNVFMPGVHVSGEVRMGDCNLLGSSSVVIQQMRIGSNIRLGAGSALMTKTHDGMTYIGVPAEEFDF